MDPGSKSTDILTATVIETSSDDDSTEPEYTPEQTRDITSVVAMSDSCCIC